MALTMTRLRVAMDGTPLLGNRTGVGRYVERLLAQLADRPDLDVSVTPFTLRGGQRPALPAGASWRRRRAPARALRWSWQRAGFPPVEVFSGRTDVFHATNFVLPPLARARGVLTVHDLSYLRFPETVTTMSLKYRDLVPAGLRRAAAVLAPSSAVASELMDTYGLPSDLVHVTPLGADPGWAQAVPLERQALNELGVPGDRYVLFVGTREPRKDLPVLLAAHRAASAERPDVVPPLVLAGPAGWSHRDGTESAVLTGYLPDATLRALVAGATLLVMPSRYEGFGLPVLEAMACGTPVLCSDIPVFREVGGDVPRYAAVGDVDGFAAQIVAACASPPSSSASAAGRHRATGFTWELCADATASAYRHAVA